MAGATLIMAGVEVGASVFSYAEQTSLADQKADLQEKQVEQQQVQLELQTTQQSIARENKLSQVMARQTVMFGAENIAPGSGSVRAIYSQDIGNFDQDENASNLNLAAKQLTLDYQREAIEKQRDATDFGAAIGLAKNIFPIIGGLKTSADLSGALKASGGTQSGDLSSGETGQSAFDINAT